LGASHGPPLLARHAPCLRHWLALAWHHALACHGGLLLL
jgi:hypothetical protein